MKIKQHNLEQPVGQRRHQKEVGGTLKTNKNGRITYQNMYCSKSINEESV